MHAPQRLALHATPVLRATRLKIDQGSPTLLQEVRDIPD